MSDKPVIEVRRRKTNHEDRASVLYRGESYTVALVVYGNGEEPFEAAWTNAWFDQNWEPLPEDWEVGKSYRANSGNRFDRFTVTAVDPDGMALVRYQTEGHDLRKPGERKHYTEATDG